MIRNASILAAVITVVVAAPGCGQRTATAAGKVTYQGKPVVWGSVTLKASDGSIHQIGINLDGTYRLDNVPTGPAQVGVASPDPKPSARARGGDDRVPAQAGPPPGSWFPLPAKYAEHATSGVTVQVGSGAVDIVLN